MHKIIHAFVVAELAEKTLRWKIPEALYVYVQRTQCVYYTYDVLDTNDNISTNAKPNQYETHLNFSFPRTNEGKSIICDVKQLSKDQITFFIFVLFNRFCFT